MRGIAYVNGAYMPLARAAVSIQDRGFLFGDAVYEVWAVRRGQLNDSAEHLARLNRSLQELKMRAPMGDRALLAVVGETMRRNHVREGIVYLQISRGAAPERDHAFPSASVPRTLVVTAKNLNLANLAKRTRYGVKVVTTPETRWARCDIKSVGLLPNVLAKQAARAQGVEAVLYDQVHVEPTDQSFKEAIAFATQGQFDGFVAVGGGSVMDTAKAANLYATYPADFLDYVNPPIGKGKPAPVPGNLDWELWQGPAPDKEYLDNIVHYNWHWFWDFGNGDIGNQGVHQMDIARWMIPDAKWPTSVVSLGGRFGYIDDGETANTQVVVHDEGVGFDPSLTVEGDGLTRSVRQRLATVGGGVELRQHGRRRGVQRAGERGGVRLVGMPGQHAADVAPMARHDRFQRRRIAHDEVGVVMRRAGQTARVVQHDQRAARGRRSQLLLQPGQLRPAQLPRGLPRNDRVEHDDAHPGDGLAVAIPLPAVALHLPQRHPAKSAPVVVVAQGEQHFVTVGVVPQPLDHRRQVRAQGTATLKLSQDRAVGFEHAQAHEGGPGGPLPLDDPMVHVDDPARLRGYREQCSRRCCGRVGRDGISLDSGIHASIVFQ